MVPICRDHVDPQLTHHLSSTKNPELQTEPLVTFHYTGCFIGIPIIGYNKKTCNTGYYNNQAFLPCRTWARRQKCRCIHLWRPLASWQVVTPSPMQTRVTIFPTYITNAAIIKEIIEKYHIWSSPKLSNLMTPVQFLMFKTFHQRNSSFMSILAIRFFEILCGSFFGGTLLSTLNSCFIHEFVGWSETLSVSTILYQPFKMVIWVNDIFKINLQILKDSETSLAPPFSILVGNIHNPQYQWPCYKHRAFQGVSISWWKPNTASKVNHPTLGGLVASWYTLLMLQNLSKRSLGN